MKTKNINWVFVLSLVVILNFIGIVTSIKYDNWTFILSTLSVTALLYGFVIFYIVTMKKTIEEDMGSGKFSKDTEPIILSEADQKIFFDELNKVEGEDYKNLTPTQQLIKECNKSNELFNQPGVYKNGNTVVLGYFGELSQEGHAPIDTDEIAEKAFYIWEKTGCEDSESNWKQAEEELKNIWYKNLKK